MYHPLVANWPPIGYAPLQCPILSAAQATHQVALPVEYTTVGRYGTQHLYHATTTGASVIGFKYRGGVIIAADSLVSSGTLARYNDVERVFRINSRTALGAGGDFANFQSIKRTIDEKMIYDETCNDGIHMQPSSLYNWLTLMLYDRRVRLNPLYVDIVLGGKGDDNKFFLGAIDMRGRAYTADAVATGFGAQLAMPLLLERIKPGCVLLNTREATDLVNKCMEVLFYRDTHASGSYFVAVSTKRLCKVLGPFRVSENWQMAHSVEGY